MPPTVSNRASLAKRALRTTRFALAAVMLVLVPGAAIGARPPITTLESPVGDRLRLWALAGTAAGNTGDRYDNRDKGHSYFPLAQFPQVTPIVHSADLPKGRLNWGASWLVHTGVVVGNSSTASSASQSGSNGRILYSVPIGHEILHQQYRSNNLYIYPEHQDHDPGRHGAGGWGDLFPANTPYLLVSQGSSSSDQPFLQAAFGTLAAFRPETKQLLTTSGLLMPAVQMLLRWTALPVAGRSNLYLSGVAHPTAFPAASLDPLAMARLAHDIQPDCLPPLAQLAVLSESPARPGVDFCAVVPHERIADTPCAVARVWRSLARTRRMTLSAEGSFDLHHRPLTYHWAILRGDPAGITLVPRNPSGSIIEVTLTRPERRPVLPGSPLESTRIDLGLFVHNGTWWSPPALVTWFANEAELRSWDTQGLPIDIAHQSFHLDVTHTSGRLGPLLDWLTADTPSAAATVFRRWIEGPALDELLAREPDIRAVEDELDLARAQLPNPTNPTNPPVHTPEAPSAAASNRLHQAQAALATAEIATGLANRPVASRIAEALAVRLTDPNLLADLGPDLDALRRENAGRPVDIGDALAREVAEFGIPPVPDRPWVFRPTGNRSTFTKAESDRIARFHVDLLNQVVRPPGFSARHERDLALKDLFPPARWRDVFRHDTAGRCLGWTRYGDGPPREFTADGHLVLDHDELGRPRTASPCTYVIKEGFLVEFPQKVRYTYSYAGPDDLRGQLPSATP